MVFVYLLYYLVAFRVIAAQTIPQIQGRTFTSPYSGKSVSGVNGIVTAKGSAGFYLQGLPDGTNITSDSIQIYTTSSTVLAQVAVGDNVTLNGYVSEYRSTSYPSDLHVTEITSPSSIKVLSSGNAVIPIILGKDRSPPTVQFTSLDQHNPFSVPGNTSSIEATNATLNIETGGLDFWESLEGALVTVPSPVVLGFNDYYGDFFAHGDWTVTGKNDRGGLTITINSAGTVDANPEAIKIAAPLDGTKNPAVKLGDSLSDITGVITYQYDFYVILPLTAPTILSSLAYDPPATTLISSPVADSHNCQLLTIADYNVDNFAPSNTAHVSLVASHIAVSLKSPDIVWLEEIQDNSGSKNDGVTNANLTLSALTTAITQAGGVQYDFVQIDPIDGTNGGEDGGNIRNAFLYNSAVVSVASLNPGNASVSTEVIGTGDSAQPTYNPGLIDPTNSAFVASRKPLVVLFKAIATGAKLWAINVHQSSKYGSTSLSADPRTPINGAVDSRIAQAKVEAAFISTILTADDAANIVIAGDFNDFRATTAVFDPFNGLVTALDDVVGIALKERYTYLFDGNTEQLDHILVSSNLQSGAKFEHIHVNTWANSTASQGSDHDPSVARLKICG